MKEPEIAILDANVLSLMGLRAMLLRIVPQARICTFQRFEQMEAHGAGEFVHYFVSVRMLMLHGQFFAMHRQRTVVMAADVASMPPLPDFHVLDVGQSEEALVRSVLRLMSLAHSGGRNLPPDYVPQRALCPLTPREREVAALLAQGLINKEVASRLGISLTTVISHRKNIMEKLHVRSVSGLAIYAVMNGLVDFS